MYWKGGGTVWSMVCTGRVEVQSGVWCVLGGWRYSLEYGVYWEGGGTVWSMVCTGRVEVQSGVWCVLGGWRYSLEYGVYWEGGGTVWSMVCTGLVEVQSGVWCVLGGWRYSLEYGVYWVSGGTYSFVCTMSMEVQSKVLNILRVGAILNAHAAHVHMNVHTCTYPYLRTYTHSMWSTDIILYVHMCTYSVEWSITERHPSIQCITRPPIQPQNGVDISGGHIRWRTELCTPWICRAGMSESQPPHRHVHTNSNT